MDSILYGADVVFEQDVRGLLLTDADGRILHANATVRGWLGYEEEELEAGPGLSCLLPRGARLFHHIHCLPQLRDRGMVTEIRFALRKRREERLPVLVNIVRGQRDGMVVDEWMVVRDGAMV